VVKFQASKISIIIWCLLGVVILLSFVSTLITNEKIQRQAKEATIARDCTSDFLGRTFEVLNERTSTTPELNASDEAKVRAEGRLFGFVVKAQATNPTDQTPPQEVIDQYNKLIRQYFDSIQKYLTTLGRTNINQTVNPIPTRTAYEACLRGDGR
jgi:hypothetical protein